MINFYAILSYHFSKETKKTQVQSSFIFCITQQQLFSETFQSFLKIIKGLPLVFKCCKSQFPLKDEKNQIIVIECCDSLFADATLCQRAPWRNVQLLRKKPQRCLKYLHTLAFYWKKHQCNIYLLLHKIISIT